MKEIIDLNNIWRLIELQQEQWGNAMAYEQFANDIEDEIRAMSVVYLCHYGRLPE